MSIIQTGTDPAYKPLEPGWREASWAFPWHQTAMEEGGTEPKETKIVAEPLVFDTEKPSEEPASWAKYALLAGAVYLVWKLVF